MNYRDVLRVYKLERQLAPDDVALLNTLREMPDVIRGLFAETLGPPEKVSTGTKQRKVKHCVVCDRAGRAAIHKDSAREDYHEFQPPPEAAGKKTGKSKRAASLASAIKGATTFCDYPDCGLNASSAIHDPNGGYAGYHAFVPAAEAGKSAVGD